MFCTDLLETEEKYYFAKSNISLLIYTLIYLATEMGMIDR